MDQERNKRVSALGQALRISLEPLCHPAWPCLCLLWIACFNSLWAMTCTAGLFTVSCVCSSFPWLVQSPVFIPTPLGFFLFPLLIASCCSSSQPCCALWRSGHGEVCWEQNWIQLGPWSFGLIGCVALRGHLPLCTPLLQRVWTMVTDMFLIHRFQIQCSWNMRGLSPQLSGKWISLICCSEQLVLIRIVRGFMLFFFSDKNKTKRESTFL